MVANYPTHPYNSGHCLACCKAANSDIKFKV